MRVLVVESPSKAKVIQKYLGNDYIVRSSGGHICELPPKDGSVDTHTFVPKWQLTSKGKAFITELKKVLKDAKELILATDPDREGEGISWHIYEEIKKTKVKLEKVQRISFNAVTKTDILNALKAPRDIDSNLVNAYLSRLMIDYLVGFNLSPVLWRKLPGSRSAGRVQSVALRILTERAEEIARFVKQEYWTIDGLFLPNDAESDIVKSRLIQFLSKKIDKLDIKDSKSAESILEKLWTDVYKVSSIDDTEMRRNPSAPFNTSSLQQAGVNELNMRSVNVMRIAQSLYEAGLITYMRTDSIMLSDGALKDCRSAISEMFGEKYLSSKVRVYKSKAKNSQEAHEAIRPTNIMLKPSDVKTFPSSESFAVYDLIWRRTIASQMESAVYLSRNIQIEGKNQNSIFSATGSKVIFDGFLKVTKVDKALQDNLLPNLNVGQSLQAKDFISEQHFTKPPAQYTEATLVKKLEELGIGRPSTYARIFSVLIDRDYAHYEGKSIVANFKGILVVYFLLEHFSKYVEYDFTAEMESRLDDISNGSMEMHKVMEDFWIHFHKVIEESFQIKITDVLSDLQKRMNHLIFTNGNETCPKCDSNLELRLGKFGPFIGCSGYSEKSCKYMRPIANDEEDLSGDLGVYEEDGKVYRVELANGPYGKYIKFSLNENSNESVSDSISDSVTEAEIEDTSKKAKKSAKKNSGKSEKPIHISIGNMTEISLEKAIFLKNLPKKMGEHDGHDVFLCNGRFGPYVKSNDIMASLKKTDDIFSIQLNRAIELIQEKTSSNASGKKKFVRKKGTTSKKAASSAKSTSKSSSKAGDNDSSESSVKSTAKSGSKSTAKTKGKSTSSSKTLSKSSSIVDSKKKL